MNTDIKQIQIIVSLLKQFSIKKIVISPGTRHVPLVHIVETDPFFECYSVVDERSAAYFALGLSEASAEPVCITCTSATATCNYMPAMQEAYERHIQLIALTADRARYQRFHGENQCINQVDMYRPFVRYAVDTPDVLNKEDYWYCNRCVNEALLELSKAEKGPIQINFLEPLSIKRLSTFTNTEIPPTRKIDRIDVPKWYELDKTLRGFKRILVLCGQYNKSSKLNEGLEYFIHRYNAVVTYDYFSNVESPLFVQSALYSEIMNSEEISMLKPDLIISFGTKVYSVLGVKYRGSNIEHWHIDPSGRVYDPIHSLKKVFAVSPDLFFASFLNNLDNEQQSDGLYLNLWNKAVSRLDLTIQGFTNHYVIRKTLENLPSHSTIHASVLNAMRLTNYSKIPNETEVMGNICADGIDGALSSFIAQADGFDGMALLVIGDLSYLYDLNAIFNTLPDNVRILVVNNYAGGEFHYNISEARIDTLNLHIAAGHHSCIGDTISFSNLSYLSASNSKELDEALSSFYKKSAGPVLLEVFTDANNDGEDLRSFLAKNRKLTRRNKIGACVKSILGEKMTVKLKAIVNGYREV